MNTDPIDQVARDQILTRLKALQHCVTEAKALLDKEQMVACIDRLEEVNKLAVFDPMYVKLIKAIENKYEADT